MLNNVNGVGVRFVFFFTYAHFRWSVEIVGENEMHEIIFFTIKFGSRCIAHCYYRSSTKRNEQMRNENSKTEIQLAFVRPLTRTRRIKQTWRRNKCTLTYSENWKFVQRRQQQQWTLISRKQTYKGPAISFWFFSQLIYEIIFILTNGRHARDLWIFGAIYISLFVSETSRFRSIKYISQQEYPTY